MEIPAVYSVFKGGEVRSADVSFEGNKIIFTSDPVETEYGFDELEDRMPVVIVDVIGLNKKELDDRLITNLKVPGGDVWLLTSIEDVEDVFDSFMGDIVKALIPYHTLRNELVMKEAFEVSDNCAPVLFMSQGRVICKGEQTKDLRTVIESMSSIGFTDIVIFDTDSMLTESDWSSLKDRFSGIIPFVRNNPGRYSEMGFQTVISDIGK